MVTDNQPLESVEIEWVMLSDWAETIGAKLYIQGGGWDRILAPPEGQPINFAVAAGVLVPWHLTNQENRFVLSFEAGDGQELNRIEGGFNVGRPVTALPGQKTRVPITGRVSMKVPGTGPYQVRMTLNDSNPRCVAFYVVDKL